MRKIITASRAESKTVQAQAYSWYDRVDTREEEGNLGWYLQDMRPEISPEHQLSDELSKQIQDYAKGIAKALGPDDSLIADYKITTTGETEHVHHGVHEVDVPGEQKYNIECNALLIINGEEHDLPKGLCHAIIADLIESEVLPKG